MILRTTLAFMLLAATPVLAQPAVAPAAKFTLDSPIEAIVADPNAKTILDSQLPGLTTNDQYDMFKTMSLKQLQGFSPDKLTDERLKQVEAGLAALH